MRMVVVTPIPTPYRDPFWERMSQRPDVELAVIYCATGRSDRPWHQETSYSYRRLFPVSRNLLSWRGEGASCYWSREITPLFRELRPDVALIGGYNHLTMLQSVRLCRNQGVPWLLMCETWRQRGGVAGRVKHRWLRHWLRGAAGGLPTGCLAAAYLSRLGVPPERQCLLPNVPDLAALRQRAAVLRRQPADADCEAESCGNRRIVLFAARMIEKKRPVLVVDAFAQAERDTDALLVMLGDGPLRAAVERRAEELKMTDRLRLPGFVPPADVHRWMSVADVFVQPSSETWGVAPIEAMACGCPVILTREIGCHADVIGGPEDGVVLERVTADSLAAALTTLRDGQSNGRPAESGPADHWLRRNEYDPLAGRLHEFLRGITGGLRRAG